MGPDLQRRELLPCSQFDMPQTVADDFVTLPKGTPVVVLGVSVDTDQDYVVIAPKGIRRVLQPGQRWRRPPLLPRVERTSLPGLPLGRGVRRVRLAPTR